MSNKSNNDKDTDKQYTKKFTVDEVNECIRFIDSVHESNGKAFNIPDMSQQYFRRVAMLDQLDKGTIMSLPVSSNYLDDNIWYDRCAKVCAGVGVVSGLITFRTTSKYYRLKDNKAPIFIIGGLLLFGAASLLYKHYRLEHKYNIDSKVYNSEYRQYIQDRLVHVKYILKYVSK